MTPNGHTDDGWEESAARVHAAEQARDQACAQYGVDSPEEQLAASAVFTEVDRHLATYGDHRRLSPDQTPATPGTAPAAPRQAMAPQHQATITIYQYTDDMAAIATHADRHRAVADKLAEALTAISRDLRDFAASLATDDNVVPEVTDDVAALADDVTEMTALAENFTAGCVKAAELADTAARWVEQVYGEDAQAMSDSGLTQASAASHH